MKVGDFVDFLWEKRGDNLPNDKNQGLWYRCQVQSVIGSSCSLAYTPPRPPQRDDLEKAINALCSNLLRDSDLIAPTKTHVVGKDKTGESWLRASQRKTSRFPALGGSAIRRCVFNFRIPQLML